MTRSPVFGALFAAALAGGAASDASAFGFLNVVTTPCTACPGGLALDIERSYHATPRWDANPSGGALRDGLQVTILGGIPAAVGVTDPALAARMEAAMVAGIEAWSSPALAFDITLGAATPATEITIGIGFTPSIGGITDNLTSFSSTRMFTNGEVSAGPFLRRSWITMNEASLTTMFASIRAELALGALQRLVAHEMGHALGLGHPSDRWDFNVVVGPGGELFTSAEAGDETAIMVPIRSQPGLSVAFDPAMRADDLAGRDVLYPVLPEPAAFLLFAVAALGLWRVR